MTYTRTGSDSESLSAFRLGDVEVHPDSLTLVVGGDARRVEPRVMDLLVYGSERAGQLLGKEQIMQDLWGSTHLVPEALQRVVSLLRKNLGDSRDEPVFVETVSRRGYRFLVEPRAMTEVNDITLTEKSIRVSPLALIAVGLVIVILAWLAFGGLQQETPPPSPPAADQGGQASEPEPAEAPASPP